LPRKRTTNREITRAACLKQASSGAAGSDTTAELRGQVKIGDAIIVDAGDCIVLYIAPDAPLSMLNLK